MAKSDNERNRKPNNRKGNFKGGTPPKGSFAEKANRYAAERKKPKSKPKSKSNSDPDLIRLNKYMPMQVFVPEGRQTPLSLLGRLR